MKRDYKYFKLLLDLRFLKNCIKNNVILKLEQFPLANLQCSNAKRTKNINKKRRVRLVQKDLSSAKNELIFRLKRIDFHVRKLFLVGNDRSISKYRNIQDKRSFKLSNSVVRDVSHDPEQLIHNFSSHILSEARKSLLCRGLHFTLNLWNMQIIPFLLNSFTKTFKLPISTLFKIKP